jgi:hypothetical protein
MYFGAYQKSLFTAKVLQALNRAPSGFVLPVQKTD